MGLLGRFASRGRGNARLQIALRKRLREGIEDFAELTSENINKLGKGLFSLSEDELEDLNPQAVSRKHSFC